MEELVKYRRDLGDHYGSNPTLESAARMFVEASLIKPDKVPVLVRDGWCTLAAVPAGGASVDKESFMAAGGLEHLANDESVLRGGLLL